MWYKSILFQHISPISVITRTMKEKQWTVNKKKKERVEKLR